MNRNSFRLLVFSLILLSAPVAMADDNQPEGEGGRFRITVAGAFGQVILLNTITGQSWKLGWYPSEDGNCKDKTKDRALDLIPAECRKIFWSPILRVPHQSSR